jgi:hypothetical protein
MWTNYYGPILFYRFLRILRRKSPSAPNRWDGINYNDNAIERRGQNLDILKSRGSPYSIRDVPFIGEVDTYMMDDNPMGGARNKI